ncbi:unnamed protein product [Leptosia nina]|uniref:Uncharacterized protein n=1 Tax=Leptosia nina TaxID=320188 RepID=A0AAV1JPL6_9NEOP
MPNFANLQLTTALGRIEASVVCGRRRADVICFEPVHNCDFRKHLSLLPRSIKRNFSENLNRFRSCDRGRSRIAPAECHLTLGHVPSLCPRSTMIEISVELPVLPMDGKAHGTRLDPYDNSQVESYNTLNTLTIILLKEISNPRPRI